jgi:NADH-quinone oxidoreductase subunit L
MGGLWRKMPITMVTSAVAVLAISGFPGLSGFWSKEEILAAAADTPGAQGIWVIGALVAGLTAFYMTRWFVLIFLGRPRWEHVETGFEHHPDHEHEHAPTGAVTAGAVAAGASAAATPERDARAVGVGRAERADDAAIVGEPAGHDLHPHESPLSMTLPLMVLAVLSAFGGFLNINPETGWLHGWLEPSVVRYAGDEPFLAHTLSMAIVVALGLIGIAAGLLLYLRRWTGPAPATGGSGAAQRAFGVDRFYERTVLAPGRIVANAFTAFDLRGIDGAVNGLAAGTGGFASVSRRLQTGLVRSYALGVLGGAVLVVVLFAAAGVVR